MGIGNASKFVIATAGALFCCLQAQAEMLCVRQTPRVGRNRTIQLARSFRVVTTPTCPRGFRKLLTPELLEPGFSLYGDASAGALTVTTAAALNGANTQYSSVHIAAGGTLSVPSGTLIRCTGTFSIDPGGTLVVAPYARGGALTPALASSDVASVPSRAAHPGVTKELAANGGISLGGVSEVGGGLAGEGLTEPETRRLLDLGAPGGGGGGAGGSEEGGQGGGTVTILCAGAVVNSGTISAIAYPGVGVANPAVPGLGAGGGGGGIVVLASGSSVANTGSIVVTGGAGGDAGAGNGPGGGGGGGCIHLISTNAPLVGGVAAVSGGAAGAAGTVSMAPRTGGGAGGNSCGAGGSGGSVPAGASVTSGEASAGAAGRLVATTADPRALL